MKKLIFIHVPKTGGVSVRRSLATSGMTMVEYGMGSDGVSQHGVAEAIRDDRVQIVAGHIYNDGLRFDMLRRRTRHMAIVLRHPVARLYSLYLHSLANPRGQLHKHAQKGLAEFASTKSHLVRNAQAHQLAGRHVEGADLYGAARVTLALFDTIGTTSKLGLFIEEMGRALGLGHAALPFRRENVGRMVKGADPMTDEVAALILSNNAVDMALWREAVKGIL